MGRLADEIKQTKPLSMESEIYLNLIRTCFALLQQESALLKAFGLSGAQYNALRILRGAEPEGLKCADISERLVTKDPDVTRLLDRLESSGLIARRRNDRDRRVIRARITGAGLGILADLDEPIESLHRRQLAHMSPATLRALNALLEEARRTVTG